MTFTLTIDCDNATFDGEQIYTELARILIRTARTIDTNAQLAGTIRDTDGNSVGYFNVKGAAHAA